MNDTPTDSQTTEEWVIDPGIHPVFAKRLVGHLKTRKKDANCKVCKIRLRSAGPGCPWKDCPHKDDLANG